MQPMQRKTVVIPCLLFACAFLATQARAGTLAYPTADKPSFLIDLPDDWKLTPGENEGDYIDVTGPTGAVISFRTIPGSEKAMQNAIAESDTYLKENYKNVNVNDAKEDEQRGLKGFFADGSGVDKEDGAAVGFVLAWYALKDGKIGEIWFVVHKDDKKGAAAAGKILDSFRAP